MDFKEILKKVDNKDEIFIGYNKDGIKSIDIRKNPSIIITGSTGTGKSILLDQIILQLINKHTSLEMGIIPIDTSGVELNYYAESRYTLYNAIGSLEKSLVALTRVLKEAERRTKLLEEAGVLTYQEYNEVSSSNLPLLVVAIDDNSSLVGYEDMEKLLSSIITKLPGLGILFILATNDVYNKFFKTNKNVLASLLISFDTADELDAKYNNVMNSDKLAIGEFIVLENDSECTYNNFDFDDELIKEILNN